MEGENLPQSSAAGKIRVRRAHGGRAKQKPYARRQVIGSGSDEANQPKGLLQKVGSFIVPSWLSNWFAGTKEEILEDTDTSDDEAPPDQTESVFRNSELPRYQVGNHVRDKKALIVNNNFVLKQSDVAQSSQGQTSRKSLTVPTAIQEKGQLQSSSSDGVERETRSEGNVFSMDLTTDTAYSSITSKISVDSSQPTIKSFSVFGTPKPGIAKSTSPAFKVSSFVATKPRTFSPSSASPFYRGRTAFGGASATREWQSKRQRLSPVASSVMMPKAKIQARSIESRGKETVSGETAKRILKALEKMSSPLQDARRMTLSTAVGSRLQAPKTSSEMGSSHVVSEGLPSTTASVSDTTTTAQTSFAMPQTFSAFKPKGLPLSFSPDDCSTAKRQSFKIKRQKTYSHQPASRAEDTELEPPNLSSIPDVTPFVVKTLPKFDFSKPEKPTNSEEAEGPKPGDNSASQERTLIQGTKTTSGKFSFTVPEVKSAPKVNASMSNARESFNFSKPVHKVVSNSVVKSAEDKDDKVSSTAGISPKSSDLKLLSTGPVSFPNFSPPKGSWECSQCLIRNKPERLACAACGHEKNASNLPLRKRVSNSGESNSTKETPEKIPTMSVKSNVFAKFAPKEGSWDCSVCMIQNDAGRLACVACQAKKPNSATSTTATEGSSTVPPSIFAKFAPKPGSWECTTCLLRNDADKMVCPSCNSPKPSSQKTKEPTALLKAGPSLFEKFAPKPGSWKCSTCLIQNEADKSSCIACSAAKPSELGDKAKQPSATNGRAVAPDKAGIGLFAKFAAKPGSWECPTCMIRNDENKEECVACQSKNPSMKGSGKPSIPSGSNVFAKFAPKPGSWDCDVCMVRNDADKTRCSACDAPKDKSAPKDDAKENVKPNEGPKFSFGVSTSTAPKFSFGLQPNSSQSAIKFGVTPAIDKNAIGAPQTFSFGVKSSSESIVFGTSPFSSSSFASTADTTATITDDAKTSKGIRENTTSGILFGAASVKPASFDAKSADLTSKAVTENQAKEPLGQGMPSSGFQFGSLGPASSATTSLPSIFQLNNANAQPSVPQANTKVNDTSEEAASKVGVTTNGISGGFAFGSVSRGTGFEATVVTSAQPPLSAGFQVSQEPLPVTTSVDSSKSLGFQLPIIPKPSFTTVSSFTKSLANVTPQLPAFGSIAEAVRGGFLQVPGLDDKSTSSPAKSSIDIKIQSTPLISNGPVSTMGTSAPFGTESAKTFSFAAAPSTSSSFSFMGQKTESTSSSMPLFSFGKGGPAQQPTMGTGLTNSAPSSNSFSFGANPPPQNTMKNESSGPAPFSFQPPTSASNVFGQSPQLGTTKAADVPSFSFGAPKTTQPSVGGFSFPQVTAPAVNTTGGMFGFSNPANPPQPQQPASNPFGSSQSAGFDFSSAATIKSGGFNFIGSQSVGGNPSPLLGGAFGGQQPLFNVGAGVSPAAQVAGRSPGLQGRKVKRATRRLK